MAVDPAKRAEMQQDMIRAGEGYHPVDAPLQPATPEQQAALDTVPDDTDTSEQPSGS